MNQHTIYFSLLLLLCLHFHPAAAQRRPAQPAQPERAATILFDLLPVSGKGYVSVFVDDAEAPTKVRLAFTGPGEQIESEKVIPLIRRGLAALVESAFIWNGELTLVTSLFYPGPQRDILLTRRYSLPDFTEVAAEQIAEAYVPGRLRVPFGYALSPDSTRIMYYSWSYAVPKDPVKMEIHVMDQDLQRLWTKRFLLPNKNANFYIYACKVDNEGNAYLLCEDYQGKVGGRIREDKIERFVLRLDANSSEATAFTIDFPDRIITDLQFTMDKAGNLYGGGFYRPHNKVNQSGFFVYRIDQATQGFQKKEFFINKDQYQQMHAYTGADGKFVSGTRQFRDYFLDQVLWDDEHGLTLIGEQRIYEEQEDKYNDIIMIRLNPELERQWAVRIPKRQTASWGQVNFISYRLLQRPGKLYVLFNDHPENMPQQNEVPGRIKSLDFLYAPPNPILHLVYIDDSARLLHQNLSEVVKVRSQMALQPYLTRSDRDDSFLLYLGYINDPDALGVVYPISWVNQ